MSKFASPELDIDLSAPEKFGNLADRLTDDARISMASDIIDLVKIDEGTMEAWLGKANGYLDKVDADTNEAAPQNNEEAEGSNEGDGPPSTMMTLSACIQFTARIVGSILSEPDLVRASEAGAEQLAGWLSSQFRTVDPDWVNDTDPLCLHMAATGLGWRKRWFDEHDQKFRSSWLNVNDVVINANAKSLERAPRIAHKIQRYPYEIRRSIEMKHWTDYEPNFDDIDPQQLQDFYEVDIGMDLDGDEQDEPWTVTLSLDDTPQIVKILPRWTRKSVTDTDDLLLFRPYRRYFAYKLIPDPKGSFFPRGFGWLLDRTERTADRLLASIDDTAKSASENGGVASTGGVGLPSKVELKGNRITTLPTDGRPISEVLTIFPDKQVTPGMVQVLDKVMTMGDRLAGTLNLMENAPASMTATLAKGLIDTGSQLQSAVHRRVTNAITDEAHAFGRMADDMDKLPEGVDASDNVAASADPNMATEMHRSVVAELYHGMLQMPMVFDPHECALRYAQTLRLPNPEKLVKLMGPPQPDPKDQADAMIKLQKNQIDKMKAKGQIILQIAQAVNALTQAGLNATNIGLVQAEITQLNAAIMELNQDDPAPSLPSGGNGISGTPGNQDPSGASPTPQGFGGGALPAGPSGGPPDAGPGIGNGAGATNLGATA